MNGIKKALKAQRKEQLIPPESIEEGCIYEVHFRSFQKGKSDFAS